MCIVLDTAASTSSRSPESDDQSNQTELSVMHKSTKTNLPRIFDGLYYNEIQEHPNGRIWANCTMPICSRRLVKGLKTTTGNFKNHYRTNHKDEFPELERYLDKKQKWEPIVKQKQTQIFASAIRKEEVISNCHL